MSPADARSKKKRAPAYNPPYAALVVDANTGRTLYATNHTALRHPASITKVMTLYLLFEQMERGRMRLDTPIPISARAAAMPPSKLGQRAGSTITVENAIGALVTKSANDIAVAVAEAIGGDEATFARMMTTRARQLGMTRTVFRNASGLPNAEQVTTAHDLAILGRAVQERFPKYFPYFSKTSHRIGSTMLRNHNRLLSRIEYVDGIKTGFIRASGFNVLTSAKLDGRRVVAVVLGGRTAAHRDNIMANLVERHIKSASRVRTAPMIAQAPAREPVRVAEAPAPVPVPPRPQEPVRAPEPVRPQEPAGAPLALVSYAALENARPAVISGVPRDNNPTASIRTLTPSSGDGSTRSASAAATATPSTLRWVAGPRGIATGMPAARESDALTPPAAIPTQTLVARVEPRTAPLAAMSAAANAQAAAPRSLVPTARPPGAREGVMIQIGATNDQEKAQELLARARSQGRAALASAQPFTEKVERGGETLWRARFAGLAPAEAESACRALKRSGFACFTTRN